MQPVYTIALSGTDPAETLLVEAAIPTTQVVFTGSVKELQARITATQNGIVALQANLASDQALLASITNVLTAAGVTDFKAPLTPDSLKTVAAQNKVATTALLQAQSDAIAMKMADAAKA